MIDEIGERLKLSNSVGHCRWRIRRGPSTLAFQSCQCSMLGATEPNVYACRSPSARQRIHNYLWSYRAHSWSPQLELSSPVQTCEWPKSVPGRELVSTKLLRISSQKISTCHNSLNRFNLCIYTHTYIYCSPMHMYLSLSIYLLHILIYEYIYIEI